MFTVPCKVFVVLASDGNGALMLTKHACNSTHECDNFSRCTYCTLMCCETYKHKLMGVKGGNPQGEVLVFMSMHNCLQTTQGVCHDFMKVHTDYLDASANLTRMAILCL